LGSVRPPAACARRRLGAQRAAAVATERVIVRKRRLADEAVHAPSAVYRPRANPDGITRASRPPARLAPGRCAARASGQRRIGVTTWSLRRASTPAACFPVDGVGAEPWQAETRRHLSRGRNGWWTGRGREWWPGWPSVLTRPGRGNGRGVGSRVPESPGRW